MIPGMSTHHRSIARPAAMRTYASFIGGDFTANWDNVAVPALSLYPVMDWLSDDGSAVRQLSEF